MKIAIVGHATQFTKDLKSFHGAVIKTKSVKDEDGEEKIVSAHAQLKIAGAAHIVNEGDWLVELPHGEKEIWPDAKFKSLATEVPEETVEATIAETEGGEVEAGTGEAATGTEDAATVEAATGTEDPITE